MSSEKSKPMETPWGEAQRVRKIAEGIERVSTHCHGGFKLSPERHARVLEKFPEWIDRKGWYEENNDAAMVVATFPELFTPWDVKWAKGEIEREYEGMEYLRQHHP